MTTKEIELIKNRILNNGHITFDEAIELCKTEEVEYLCKCANEIREHYSGNKMDLCSIVNAKSGRCEADCKWCTQSSYHDTDVNVYEMIDKDDAVAQAKSNYKKGVHKFSLVTSGIALSDIRLDRMLVVYEEVQKQTKLELCASMGLLKKHQLEKLSTAGIRNYHCNLETSPSFFKNVVSTHTYEEKIETMKWAKEAGLELCSGGIIGMGESMEHRIELAFELKKLNVKSIPLNLLNSVDGTALEKAKPLSDNEVLVTFAMFRFINPKSQIRFAGGRMQIAHIEEKALKAGINAALVGDLLTSVGKDIDEDVANLKRLGYDVTK